MRICEFQGKINNCRSGFSAAGASVGIMAVSIISALIGRTLPFKLQE